MQRDIPDVRFDFATFVRESCGSSREEFVAAHVNPLLVQLNEPEGPGAEPVSHFSTLLIDRAAVFRRDEPLFVHPVRKNGTNPFAMITVGRAPNNDIVLPYEEISKFHAFFVNRGRGWLLADAQSRNGTFLRGVRLEPNAAVAVDIAQSGPIEVGFAGTRMLLVDAGQLWDLAASRRRQAAVA